MTNTIFRCIPKALSEFKRICDTQYPKILDNCVCRFIGGGNFSKPAEKRSENGFLSTSLHVGIESWTLEWLTTLRRLYNGTFPGPTLRIKAGDQVRLDLVFKAELAVFKSSGLK